MGDGDHDQDHAQPGPVANSTHAMVRDAGEACSCSAPSSRATVALVRSFSTNSRPALRAAACGGRPRPADHGRRTQSAQATTITATPVIAITPKLSLWNTRTWSRRPRRSAMAAAPRTRKVSKKPTIKTTTEGRITAHSSAQANRRDGAYAASADCRATFGSLPTRLVGASWSWSQRELVWSAMASLPASRITPASAGCPDNCNACSAGRHNRNLAPDGEHVAQAVDGDAEESCRGSFRALPTRQAVTEDWPHPLV